MPNAEPSLPATFSDLPLLPSLVESLMALGLTTLTDVQRRALPVLLERRSVVAIAETGSGKTLSYVLPILDRLKRLEDDGNRVLTDAEPRALVLVPTRELGEQVAGVFKSLTHATRLRVRAVLGGQPMKQNRESVAGNFEILVATPGRVERLIERDELSLAAIRFVVLDEADQLLDMGFLYTVTAIVQKCPTARQLACFSATTTPAVRDLVARIFREAELVETAGSHKVVGTLRTRHVEVPDGRRRPALERVLAERVDGGTILFANTREQCDLVAEAVRAAGATCVVHRGEMDRVERRQNLRAFREGRVAMIVTTDMAARGLDIEHVARVINVHLPRELENYLHRVGRTARAGRGGEVVNLVTPRDAALMAALGDGSVAPAPVRLPRVAKPAPRLQEHPATGDRAPERRRPQRG